MSETMHIDSLAQQESENLINTETSDIANNGEANIPDHNKESLMTEKTIQQLEFISDVSELSVPIVIVGGYAEDALIDADIMREHHDVDTLVGRENIAAVKDHL